jgi:hypothetical protein
MPTIDTNKISKEAKDKYSVVNNAFSLSKIKNAELDLYDGKPKDELNVIVGDDKQPDKFHPQVKLSRWSNEVNFSVRLIDNEVGEETITTDKDKIIWEKGNIKIENYETAEGDGGYKFVWYLKSKPVSNIVNFTIQSKGLDFFYQPELTPEEIAEGAFRPPEVVGSYAVYHQTKGGMVDAYGKDYKIGKAFHIFRPHLFDSNGLEAWGNLHIKNGIYSVEIPQDFLDKAVYPIKSNDTFGYTTAGGTAFSTTAGGLTALVSIVDTYTASTGDTITGYSIYGQGVSVTRTFQLSAYVYSGGVPTTRLHTAVDINATVGTAWHSITDLSNSLANGVVYCIGIAQEVGVAELNYDAGTAPGRLSSTDTSETGDVLNDPFGSVGTDSGRHYSIYATYTPSGGGTVVKDIIQSGLIAFAR